MLGIYYIPDVYTVYIYSPSSLSNMSISRRESFSSIPFLTASSLSSTDTTKLSSVSRISSSMMVTLTQKLSVQTGKSVLSIKFGEAAIEKNKFHTMSSYCIPFNREDGHGERKIN